MKIVKMSSEAAAEEMCCANCGISAIDDVKLKDCDGGCDLVKYCSNKCLKNHREQHEEDCRERLAELRHDNLFTPPEGSHHGECPICCLPLPIDRSKSTMMPCCSKLICNGCDYTNQKREVEAGLEPRCAFCREPVIKSDREIQKRFKKRIKKNCPVALCHVGKMHRDKGDFKAAFEYFTKAAELEDTEAHFELSIMYQNGEGVQKDMKKETYHLEEAAVAGHPQARRNLGCNEYDNGNPERAKKHWMIAANLGEHESLSIIKDLYADGHASKEDYANALRAYQAAVQAVKSPEREEAQSYYSEEEEAKS